MTNPIPPSLPVRALAFALPLLVLVACGGSAETPVHATAAADDTPPADTAPVCRLCDKSIPEGAGVSAVIGDDSRDYRCIHCALTDLKDETADVEIHATTPLDSTVVELRRHNGGWASSPASTVFLILPERADECLDIHQPFGTRDEFDRYLAAHPEIAAERPEAFTIGRYEQILVAGLPK